MNPGEIVGVSGGVPQIRFFQDGAGRRIAYASHGQGPPLVCSAWWVSHLEEDWGDDRFRAFFEKLGEHFTVYRYDRPGSGLSDRERDAIDLENETNTLESLIDYLGLQRTSIFGLSCAGPPSIGFAHRHPTRVDKLVLFGSFMRGLDVAPPPMQAAVTQLVQAHWGMGARMITDLFDPTMSVERRTLHCAVQRKSASKEMAAQLLSLTFETDVGEAARGVTCPILVLHRKGDPAIPFSAGRELAATLPNATFEPLDGGEHVPWYGDVDTALTAMLRFLDATPTKSTSTYYELVELPDVWRMRFGGEPIFLKPSRGLTDLAILLQNPGQEVHVRTLMSGGADHEAEDDEPMLDDEALAAYRSRLRDIENELDDATGAMAERLRSEKETIARELRSAVGLGGRKRKLNPATERARKAVTARLRATIEKISAASPAAAKHLESSIQTGAWCAYRPSETYPWAFR